MKFNIPVPVMPSEDQMRVWAERHLAPGRAFRVDAWPEALKMRAGRLIEIPLEGHEQTAMCALWAALADCCRDQTILSPLTVPVDAIGKRVEQAVNFWGQGAFVRLNTRSPKDNFEWLDEAGKPRPLFSGSEAMAALVGSMERIYEDLHAALLLAGGTNPKIEPVSIVVRPFETFEPWREVRLFIEEGKLVGASQYFYHDTFPNLKTKMAAWEPAIHRAVQAIQRRVAWSSFTLDGWMDEVGTFRFLEVNPPVSAGVTDPALFRDGKLDGSFRVRS